MRTLIAARFSVLPQASSYPSARITQNSGSHCLRGVASYTSLAEGGEQIDMNVLYFICSH